jgi:hypothetical protein
VFIVKSHNKHITQDIMNKDHKINFKDLNRLFINKNILVAANPNIQVTEQI